MAGYIVNADRVWFDFLVQHRISSPLFWFKRDRNPAPRFLAEGNSVFLRVTETVPAVIRGYGTIGHTGPMELNAAFDRFGHRLGYGSIQEMIDFSTLWRGETNPTSRSTIYLVEVRNFVDIAPIRVDTDLDALGIVFDYQHIVTGKGLTDEQTAALTQLVLSRHSGPLTLVPIDVDQAVVPADGDDEGMSTPSARFLETHLQWFVFHNLNCLGRPGVRLYDPEKQSPTLGKYLTTEVGEMDLLLQGANGELIVVELKKSGTDRTIGQILRYMGWVKHRLARSDQSVHGIVVTQDHDDRLRYAASVVPGLMVKRVAISFNVTSEDMALPE